MSERRTIEDEFGELTQRLSTRGKWITETRTINGVTFNVDQKRKTADYLLALKAAGAELRLNVLNDRAEVRGNLRDLPKEWQPLSDVFQSSLMNWMLDVDMVGRERIADAITTAAYRNRYHPICEYFEGLKWDGEDHIGAMLSHFTFDRKTDVIGQTFIRKWLIGSVAKIMERGQTFMLVIDGPQGIGKSYWARWLCPLPTLFLESPIHPDDKDSYLRLASYWIWEVGELGATTRRSDRDALKDFVTRQEVTIRKPYGRFDIIKPSTASLIGTINEDGGGFLNDKTGNRRFAVCRIEEIDHDYASLDVNQIWAQAVALYRDGATWELEKVERIVQEAIHEQYESMSAVEEYLWSRYRYSPNGSGDWYASSEILGNLKLSGLNGNDRANLMELSAILKRSGCEKSKRDGRWGFDRLEVVKQ